MFINCVQAGVVAFKLYPAGATTNSDSGVTDFNKCLPTLRAMAEVCRSTWFSHCTAAAAAAACIAQVLDAACV